MNEGKPYKKTIESKYDEGEYTYTQINNESTYWDHNAYKRTYDFKPIVDLSTYQSDLSGDKYKLAKEFFYNSLVDLQDGSFKPNFAVLIDGAPNEIDNSESTRSVTTEDSIDVYSEVSNVSYQGGYKYLTKRVSHCHEVYNAFILKATARQDKGDLITFNCLGDPSFVETINFVGEGAPALSDLILNDVGNWFNEIADPIKTFLWIVFGVICLLVILWIIKKIVGIFKNKNKVKVKVDNDYKKKK